MPTIKLNNVPDDVHDAILKEQKRLKKKKGVKVFSQEWTVYAMIRDLMRCRKVEPKPQKNESFSTGQ